MLPGSRPTKRAAPERGGEKARIIHPRGPPYPFIANIELTDVVSEAHLGMQTRDLSLFRCHVASEEAFPETPKIRLRIVHAAAVFGALRRVVYAGSNSGRGIEFAVIDRSDQLLLEKWICELTDSRSKSLIKRKSDRCGEPFL